MSDFERRVASVSRQEIGKFAERILPDQCPDLKPLVDMTANVLRLSQDIKSEIAMLDGFVRNTTSQPEEPKDEEEKENLFKQIVQYLLDQFNLSELWEGEESVPRSIIDALKDILLGWLSEKVADIGLQWEEALDILRTIMSFIHNARLKKLYDAFGGLAAPNNVQLAFTSIGKTLDEIEKLKERLEQIVESTDEQLDYILQKQAEQFAVLFQSSEIERDLLNRIDVQTQLNQDDIHKCYELLEFLTESDSVIQQALADLSRDMGERHDAQMQYMRAIYDKLVECCVVESVSELDEKVTDISQVLEHVSDTLAGGTPTSTRNAQGEIMTQLRVIQGQVEEIRRLL